jgi:hypothetical protein
MEHPPFHPYRESGTGLCQYQGIPTLSRSMLSELPETYFERAWCYKATGPSRDSSSARA